MRALLLLLAISFLASPAMANRCLPVANMVAAVARSVQEGIDMGVTDGSPWWAQGVVNGQACVIIEDAPRQSPGDGKMTGYDFTANPAPDAINKVPVNKVGAPTGLTPSEIATLTSLGTQQAVGP